MEEKIEKIRQNFENSQKTIWKFQKIRYWKKLSFEKSVSLFNLNHDNRDTHSEDFICKQVKNDISPGDENIRYTGLD